MRIRSPFAAVPAIVCCATAAQAQAGVRLSTQVSTRVVELGDSFQLQVTALAESDQPAPSSPRLPAPPGAIVHGPSMSTQQQVVMRGGSVEQRRGFTATWSITPNKLGKLRVGPPSVLVGARQVQGDAVVVNVVERGKGPAARSPGPGRSGFPNDPLDFFRQRRGSLFPPGLFDDPFDDLDQSSPFVPNYPPDFAVARAPDPIAFLRSDLDKHSAVVGEQVTLSIYAYGSRGPFREINSNEPQAADFVSFPIIENSYNEERYQVDIGDDIWQAVKVRELALFPIRTGNLQLGKMRMGFLGRGYSLRSTGQGLMRESELLTVTVTEPPLAGRPAGYRIGDVGSFHLNAQVEPREARQGDAVAVSVTLKGVGNLPLKLDVPERPGVEWLEPQVRGDVNPQQSVVQGVRTFQYVVRLHKAGTIDLGELRLPYWDPRKHAYFTASATLGKVQVAPAPGGDQPQSSDHSPGKSSKLAGALSIRKELGEAASERARFPDASWFWALLGLSPVAVTATGISVRLGQRLRRRLATRRKDATSLAARALGEAEKALARGEAKAAAAEAERALFLAVEGATGLKARGFLRDELVSKLDAGGIDADTARQLSEVLTQCETARFTGDSATSETGEIIEQSKDLVEKLARLRRSQARSR